MWPYHIGTKKSHPPVGESRPLFPGAQKMNFLLVLIQYEWDDPPPILQTPP